MEIDPLKRADWTPLMLACTKQNEEIVRILVEHGASLTLRNKDGWNCFQLACREGNARIVSYFLDKSPFLWQTTSKNGRTPIHSACKFLHFIPLLHIYTVVYSTSRTQSSSGVTGTALQLPKKSVRQLRKYASYGCFASGSCGDCPIPSPERNMQC